MASKRHLRRKACTGKVRFTSKQEAAMSAKWHLTLVPYGCPFCGGYHIGHQPKRMRAAARQARRNKG